MSLARIYYQSNVETWPSTGTELTDYYLGTSPIPRYYANEDFSPVIMSARLVFTENIPVTFELNKGIRIVPSSGDPFTYLIKKIRFDRIRRQWTLQCESLLSRLRDKYITVANLDDHIKNGIVSSPTDNDYKYRDNRYTADPTYDYSNMSVLWIIKVMFEDCNLRVLLSDKDDTALTYGGDDYEFEEICMDYAQFWVLGQIDNKVSGDSLISYFDFIQAFCSFFGCTFLQYDNRDFQLNKKASLTEYTPSNDLIQDEIITDEVNEYEGLDAVADVYWTGNTWEYYDAADYSADTNLNTNVAQQPTFNWINNLVFQLRSLTGSAGDVMGDGHLVAPGSNDTGIVYNGIKESIENDFKEYEWLFHTTSTTLGTKHNAIFYDLDFVDGISRLLRRIKIV